MFLFVASDTFAVGCTITKCTTESESKKHVRVLVYIHYLLFSRVAYFRHHSSLVSHATLGHVNLVKSRDLLTYTLECVDL